MTILCQYILSEDMIKATYNPYIYYLADLYNDRKNCCTVCTALLYIFHILVLIQYAAVHWGLITLLLMCELHS